MLHIRRSSESREQTSQPSDAVCAFIAGRFTGWKSASRGVRRHFSTLSWAISSIIFGTLVAASLSSASAGPIVDPNFSVDPASPSIDRNITPDDVLEPGPIVHTQGTDLGLQDDFFSGVFDVLNALSYGNDPIETPLFFSVDRVAVGLPGSAVNSEAQPGVEEAAGDVYQTLPPIGSNSLFIDEEQLGLIPGFFGDDLDALDLDMEPEPFTYFSIDLLSATNDFGVGDLANDILVSDGSGGFDIYAEGVEDIGLLPGDDLDALVLFDFGDGNLDPDADPMIDFALFSLSTFSPSTFTFTGNEYIPGIEEFLSPADILFTDFSTEFLPGQKYTLFASALDIGLFPDDEVNALDTVVSEPESFALFGAGLICLWASRRRRRQAQS